MEERETWKRKGKEGKEGNIEGEMEIGGKGREETVRKKIRER